MTSRTASPIATLDELPPPAPADKAAAAPAGSPAILSCTRAQALASARARARVIIGHRLPDAHVAASSEVGSPGSGSTESSTSDAPLAPLLGTTANPTTVFSRCSACPTAPAPADKHGRAPFVAPPPELYSASALGLRSVPALDSHHTLDSPPELELPPKLCISTTKDTHAVSTASALPAPSAAPTPTASELPPTAPPVPATFPALGTHSHAVCQFSSDTQLVAPGAELRSVPHSLDSTSGSTPPPQFLAPMQLSEPAQLVDTPKFAHSTPPEHSYTPEAAAGLPCLASLSAWSAAIDSVYLALFILHERRHAESADSLPEHLCVNKTDLDEAIAHASSCADEAKAAVAELSLQGDYDGSVFAANGFCAGPQAGHGARSSCNRRACRQSAASLSSLTSTATTTTTTTAGSFDEELIRALATPLRSIEAPIPHPCPVGLGHRHCHGCFAKWAQMQCEVLANVWDHLQTQIQAALSEATVDKSRADAGAKHVTELCSSLEAAVITAERELCRVQNTLQSEPELISGESGKPAAALKAAIKGFTARRDFYLPALRRAQSSLTIWIARAPHGRAIAVASELEQRQAVLMKRMNNLDRLAARIELKIQALEVRHHQAATVTVPASSTTPLLGSPQIHPTDLNSTPEPSNFGLRSTPHSTPRTRLTSVSPMILASSSAEPASVSTQALSHSLAAKDVAEETLVSRLSVTNPRGDVVATAAWSHCDASCTASARPASPSPSKRLASLILPHAISKKGHGTDRLASPSPAPPTTGRAILSRLPFHTSHIPRIRAPTANLPFSPKPPGGLHSFPGRPSARREARPETPADGSKTSRYFNPLRARGSGFGRNTPEPSPQTIRTSAPALNLPATDRAQTPTNNGQDRLRPSCPVSPFAILGPTSGPDNLCSPTIAAHRPHTSNKGRSASAVESRPTPAAQSLSSAWIGLGRAVGGSATPGSGMRRKLATVSPLSTTPSAHNRVPPKGWGMDEAYRSSGGFNDQGEWTWAPYAANRLDELEVAVARAANERKIPLARLDPPLKKGERLFSPPLKAGTERQTKYAIGSHAVLTKVLLLQRPVRPSRTASPQPLRRSPLPPRGQTPLLPSRPRLTLSTPGGREPERKFYVRSDGYWQDLDAWFDWSFGQARERAAKAHQPAT